MSEQEMRALEIEDEKAEVNRMLDQKDWSEKELEEIFEFYGRLEEQQAQAAGA